MTSPKPANSNIPIPDGSIVVPFGPDKPESTQSVRISPMTQDPHTKPKHTEGELKPHPKNGRKLMCGDTPVAVAQSIVGNPPEAWANARKLMLGWNFHDRLVKALELSQKSLANCTPTCEIDGPKPMPIIAQLLADIEKAEKE